jgi:hypothetical protein
LTEPRDVFPDSLANLGPLRRLAGTWQADKGIDINSKARGPERRTILEHSRMDFGWSYSIQTALFVRGGPFHHRDSNALELVATPEPNPLAVIVHDRAKWNGPAA